MRNLYYVLSGVMIFFFVFTLYDNLILWESSDKFNALILPAIAFGIISALMSSIIIFLKIKETMGALIIVSAVINFLFVIIFSFGFEIFQIVPGDVILGAENLKFDVNEKTVAVVLIAMSLTLVTALMRFLEAKL